jgi:hypothetical protein
MNTKRISILGDVACDMVMTNEKGEYVHEYDEDLHKIKVQEFASRHGVLSKMVDPEGPGGGHPVYEFTGTRAQLESFVTEFYEAGQAHSEDLEFYFEDAKDVEG